MARGRVCRFNSNFLAYFTDMPYCIKRVYSTPNYISTTFDHMHLFHMKQLNMPLDVALANVVDQMIVYVMKDHMADPTSTRISVNITHNNIHDSIFTMLAPYSEYIGENIKKQLHKNQFNVDLRLPFTVTIDICSF